jgi:uncharacterized YccA/Bax inhibitor family protein
MALMRGSPVLSEERFGRAARDGASSAPFTVQGAITATGVLMVLLVASAAVGWAVVPEPVVLFDRLGNPIDAQPGDIPGWVFVAGLVGLGFALVTMFKPKAARITAPLYALSYGVVVGAISHVYNSSYDGIVTQALFATLSIFTVMLLLYATRIIKVTNRFVMVVVGATMGIALMYLAAFVVSLFGGEVGFLNDGGPLAIGISLFIIVIGALNLAIDFAFIERAGQHAVPKYLEWYAGFGVVVTLVWIYLEVLRLLAMLNRRN